MIRGDSMLVSLVTLAAQLLWPPAAFFELYGDFRQAPLASSASTTPPSPMRS